MLSWTIISRDTAKVARSEPGSALRNAAIPGGLFETVGVSPISELSLFVNMEADMFWDGSEIQMCASITCNAWCTTTVVDRSL